MQKEITCLAGDDDDFRRFVFCDSIITSPSPVSFHCPLMQYIHLLRLLLLLLTIMVPPPPYPPICRNPATPLTIPAPRS